MSEERFRPYFAVNVFLFKDEQDPLLDAFSSRNGSALSESAEARGSRTRSSTLTSGEAFAAKAEPLQAKRVLSKGSSVFLIRRANTGWGDGQYGIAQGHVEAGETALAAAVRETKEEAGVVVQPSDLRFVHVLHRSSPQGEGRPPRIYVDVFFVAERWNGEPHLAEPERSDDAGWFPTDALPENTYDLVRAALEHLRAGRCYSEFGWQHSS